MEIITVLLNLVGLIALLFGFLVLTAVILYLIVSALAKVTEYLPGLGEEPLTENLPRREEKPIPAPQPRPVETPPANNPPALFGAGNPHPVKPVEAPKPPPPNNKPDNKPTPDPVKTPQVPKNPQKQQQQQTSHQPTPNDAALHALFQKLAVLGEDIKEIKALDKRIETLEEWFEQQEAELVQLKDDFEDLKRLVTGS